MKKFPTIVGGLCLLALAGNGWAQAESDVAEPAPGHEVEVDTATLSPVMRMNTAYSTYAFEYAGFYGDMISPQDTMRLAIIARQRAIALQCDGFEVDEARYNAAMEPVMGPLIEAARAKGDGDSPVLNLPFTIGMSAYSILLGGHLAVGAYDLDAECAYGERMRAELSEEGGEDLLIWK